MSELRCVVAEDEALLREALISELRAVWPELQIVAACEDGGSALEEITENAPDVAFLDIRMPGLSGMDVAQAVLEAGLRTQIVFVTAYDQYAIDAFEKGAVDYLLKPVTRERLAATVQRLKERAARGAAQPAALAELLQQLNASLRPASKEPPLTWLTASSGNDTRLIMIDDVAYFRSDNKYTVVMTAEGEALLRKPICDLLKVLNPDIFKQIHRSTIVNLKAVSAISRDEMGKGVMRLKNRPETLQVSQAFMTQFRNM
ncbi:LytR/AlgR family response regulator transcription factor [Massilia endophytica]|uniref:LytR/AlgR family response regulator transcription factor n=1 Tax=Massilia endophytica TaxID=2899220 RepID=UPI001E3FEC6C|nr:LytTR family DNA-binding domain-containing protein [Massilia endophytica]UGQ48241.1 LytTR family DNA-binding domain-containing protein [Massilia endophytica]